MSISPRLIWWLSVLLVVVFPFAAQTLLLEAGGIFTDSISSRNFFIFKLGVTSFAGVALVFLLSLPSKVPLLRKILGILLSAACVLCVSFLLLVGAVRSTCEPNPVQLANPFNRQAPVVQLASECSVEGDA